MATQCDDIFDSSFTSEKRLVIVGLQAANEGAAAGGEPVADAPLYARKFNAFGNKTLEQKVQELADREEIRELIACYAHRIARGISAADLFTEDGSFSIRVPGQPQHETRSLKAIEEMYAKVRPEDEHPLPMIHNYQLAIDGDEAIGLCSNELRIVDAGESVIASGYYEDRLRRENGCWKFVVRDASFFHWVPIQQGWARPIETE